MIHSAHLIAVTKEVLKCDGVVQHLVALNGRLANLLPSLDNRITSRRDPKRLRKTFFVKRGTMVVQGEFFFSFGQRKLKAKECSKWNWKKNCKRKRGTQQCVREEKIERQIPLELQEQSSKSTCYRKWSHISMYLLDWIEMSCVNETVSLLIKCFEPILLGRYLSLKLLVLLQKRLSTVHVGLQETCSDNKVQPTFKYQLKSHLNWHLNPLSSKIHVHYHKQPK